MPIIVGGEAQELPVTFGDLRSIFKRQVGHDLPDEEADRLLNEAYRQLVGGAKWLMAEIELGETVVGQSRYAVPTTVVDLESVRVAGSYPYRRVGTADLWHLKAGAMGVPEPGVFAPAFDDLGAAYVELYPAPTLAGETVLGLAAVLPPAMTSAGDVPKVPADFYTDIVRGAHALLLERSDEQHEEAAVLRAEFREAVGRLALRKNSRIGSGPSQIQVQGYHF